MRSFCCRFMRGVEGFDAACFGIHASEALVMDPQQRLMLEVSIIGLSLSVLCMLS